jgi:hypothetical protein
MITCYVRYVVNPSKLKEFEAYGKMALYGVRVV